VLPKDGNFTDLCVQINRKRPAWDGVVISRIRSKSTVGLVWLFI